ncbi:hypothetical protein [Anaerophaga thermohalophila]|uniref:hypothetical protein n=1 Tax=Anaerophaga thermohalophila TaxID=177400 RepID=UPI001FE1D881|nr:hypothetical protein [Anaerophaga thermohalophila]
MEHKRCCQSHELLFDIACPLIVHAHNGGDFSFEMPADLQVTLIHPSAGDNDIGINAFGKMHQFHIIIIASFINGYVVRKIKLKRGFFIYRPADNMYRVALFDQLFDTGKKIRCKFCVEEKDVHGYIVSYS